MNTRLDDWFRGLRGPAFAALVAMLAGLPGLLALPPLDRDESRFAQATVQMLETRDFVKINYQDQPRDKKPVGIHWLQAASVSLFSNVEDRQIWAWRIPSLLGAMLAAAACAWGAAAFLGPRGGMLAGVFLGAGFMLSTEAGIAKTDAVLCGATTLALAAMARLYLASRGGPPAGRRTKVLFWFGLGLATLVKGPIGPMIALLTGLALWAWDRKADWVKTLGWTWGLVIFVAMVGPWAVAITIATDGAFWGAAIGGDLAPKLVGGHESHGAPAGMHLLLAPILIFPFAFILPAALFAGWRGRNEPGIRFALCWLIPAWLVFELMPTKLVHYTLPTYGALAWLAAAAAAQVLNRTIRITGSVLAVVSSLVFCALGIMAVNQFGTAENVLPTAVAVALYAATGLVASILLLRQAPQIAILASACLGVAAHSILAGLVVPGLKPLMLSSRTAHAMRAEGLAPRMGLLPGPVTVAGYAEPSLVFALGTKTELSDGAAAAKALAEGRPAIVESRQQVSFDTALIDDGVKARMVGQIDGLNYSNGDATSLRLYRPLIAPDGREPHG